MGLVAVDQDAGAGVQEDGGAGLLGEVRPGGGKSGGMAEPGVPARARRDRGQIPWRPGGCWRLGYGSLGRCRSRASRSGGHRGGRRVLRWGRCDVGGGLVRGRLKRLGLRGVVHGKAVGGQGRDEGDDVGQAQSGCGGDPLCLGLLVGGQLRDQLVPVRFLLHQHGPGLFDLVPQSAQIGERGAVALCVHRAFLVGAFSQRWGGW